MIPDGYMYVKPEKTRKFSKRTLLYSLIYFYMVLSKCIFY